jgi:hypothetical protein
MPRIDLIPLRRADAGLRDAYRTATRLWGARSGAPFALKILQCFSQRPDYVAPVARGYYYTGWCGTLPRTTRESVAVLISRLNDCFY